MKQLNDVVELQSEGVSPAASAGPVEMIDALNATFGRHVGTRSSHAKGLCIEGVFEPSDVLRSHTSATLFQSSSLEVVGRFSVGGGSPTMSDKSRTVRGLAIRIGGQYDLVLISESIFFAATPESFVSFLKARVPDLATGKPDPEKVAAHNRMFPEGVSQPAKLASHAAPASYATTAYYSTHAFGLKAKNGEKVWMRMQLLPKAGVRYLTADEERTFSDSFLPDELLSRLELAPVEFQVLGQLRQEDDSLTDPTKEWIGTQFLTLGLLKITAINSMESCDAMIFSPTLLPPGIESADDPIIRTRASAYSVSFERRRPV